MPLPRPPLRRAQGAEVQGRPAKPGGAHHQRTGGNERLARHKLLPKQGPAPNPRKPDNRRVETLVI